MTFSPDNVETFKTIFNENKSAIRNFPGCLHVELQRDVNRPEVFFTISRWDSEDALDAYRKSELFAGVWRKTKVLFAGKAEAWSFSNAD